MNIKYFKDTNTALLEFSAEPVDETREISQNVYVELDRHGNIASTTTDHAADVASFPAVHLQELASAAV